MICCLEIINGNLENLELLHGGFDCFLKTSAGDNVCGPYVLTNLLLIEHIYSSGTWQGLS